MPNTEVAPALRYHQRGNRCEGVYRPKCAGEAHLELISLTLGPIQYQLTSGVIIIVAPELGSLVSGPVHVLAVAKPEGAYYRMDAIVEVASPLRWPVNDVLVPYHLHQKRIGIRGWIEKNGSKVYVPLRVMEQNAGPAGNELWAVVYAPVDANHVIWRIREQRQPAAPYSKWHEVAQSIAAGDIVTIKLPAESKASAFEVEIEATTGKGIPDKLVFSVAR